MMSSVQLLSHVQLFATPWTAGRWASVSIKNCCSLLKTMSNDSVMPSNHLILCRPLILPSIFPSIRFFSNEPALLMRWPKYWSFSLNISPSNEYSRLISFWIFFALCHNGGVICISEVINISPGNLDSRLCFIEPGISHDVLCIEAK